MCRMKFAPVLKMLWLVLFAGINVVFAEESAILERHCVACHGRDGKVKGKVDLLAAKLSDDLELTRRIIELVDSGEMPPEEKAPLKPDERQRLVSELRGILHLAAETRRAYPATPVRRMNRFQYNNAVKDLFGLKVEVFSLPEKVVRDYGYFRPETGKMPDSLKAGSRPLGKSQLIEKRLDGVAPFPQDLRAEHGFDNRGDHLSLSPLLMESFLKLGQSVVNSSDFGPGTCGIWKDFFEKPAEDAEGIIDERLRRFLTRAFRRPVDEATLGRYAGRVMSEIRAGAAFEDAMKTAASAAICSPRFLYLHDLDEFDLAARLSFFLWGSGPDEALMGRASSGELNENAVLSAEVDRMLNDARLKRFCDSFPAQWLQMDRIITSVPDKELFPNFYFGPFRGSMHMMLEPLLVFETILVENRSILDLIDSDFSYRSDYLIKWYEDGGLAKKIPPTAIPFQRVGLTDRREGGVFTTAAVMTMTSNATRTQPITRGAWMATVIFNSPPEPPPADVPPLSEKPSADEEKMTLRERLEAHRERPDCAGCHARIDPLGFALENYGPTGLWRNRYENGRPVDAAGELFRRHPFTDVVGLKDAILLEKDRFTRAFAAHVLSFALGREISAVDEPALARIVDACAGDGYRMRTLIKEVALSEPFRAASGKAFAKAKGGK
jgi:cytochrome c551/c552